MLKSCRRIGRPWLPQACLAVALAAASPPVAAQGGGATQAAPEAADLARRAAGRFPQPVRVGDLAGRQVLEPSNRQGLLGRVEGVSRTGTGGLLLVVRYGGVLGYGARPIAVPIEATALLGPFVQIVDIDRARLDTLPTFDGAGSAPLGPDEVIRVGINRN
jgi:hypothetical protein